MDTFSSSITSGMVYIIGLTGLAHSGKDTSADYLVQSLTEKGYKVCKVALADQLKVICQRLIHLFHGISFPLEDFHDQVKKEVQHPELPVFGGRPFCLRTILQIVGTEVFRQLVSDQVWCRYVDEQICACADDQDIVIISDIRMPNEIEYFRKYPSYFIRVQREQRGALFGTNSQHSSETQISTLIVDKEINNNGTFEDLYQKLDQVPVLGSSHARD